MPNIVKIGMTERTPLDRLKEANKSDTWRPPTPYKLEFAKKVSNPKQKEKQIHLLLSSYKLRINPRREFFRATPSEVMMFFDLIDGDMWFQGNTFFKDGQQIRHVIDLDDNNVIDLDVIDLDDNDVIDLDDNDVECVARQDTWMCKFDAERNVFVRGNGLVYDSSIALMKDHYSNLRIKNFSAMKKCEYEINGEWKTFYQL
jgi:hypothetical protein